MGGLGFNGYDENGRAKWNRMTNVNILKLEVRALQWQEISLTNSLVRLCAVVFRFHQELMEFWFSYISFCFCTVRDELEGRIRQLEYRYTPVVEKVR